MSTTVTRDEVKDAFGTLGTAAAQGARTAATSTGKTMGDVMGRAVERGKVARAEAKVRAAEAKRIAAEARERAKVEAKARAAAAKAEAKTRAEQAKRDAKIKAEHAKKEARIRTEQAKKEARERAKSLKHDTQVRAAELGKETRAKATELRKETKAKAEEIRREAQVRAEETRQAITAQTDAGASKGAAIIQTLVDEAKDAMRDRGAPEAVVGRKRGKGRKVLLGGVVVGAAGAAAYALRNRAAQTEDEGPVEHPPLRTWLPEEPPLTPEEIDANGPKPMTSKVADKIGDGKPLPPAAEPIPPVTEAENAVDEAAAEETADSDREKGT